MCSPCVYASDSPSAVAQRLAALQAANIQYLESDNIDLATTVRFECHLVATSIELLILDIDAQISVGHLREPAGALPKLLALAQRLDALGISTTLVQRGTVEALHPDLAKALDGIVTITASMNVSHVPTCIYHPSNLSIKWLELSTYRQPRPLPNCQAWRPYGVSSCRRCTNVNTLLVKVDI